MNTATETPKLTIVSTKTDRYGDETHIVECDELRFKIEVYNTDTDGAYIEPMGAGRNYNRAYHVVTSVGGYSKDRTLDEALAALAAEIAELP